MTIANEYNKEVYLILMEAEMKIMNLTGVRVLLEMNIEEKYNNVEDIRTDDASQPGSVTAENLHKLTYLICNYFDITNEAFISPNRSRKLVLARQLFIYLVCKPDDREFGLSAIARILKRNHATIRHARNTFINLLEVRDNMAVKALESVARKLINI